jgi:hypothetical protein
MLRWKHENQISLENANGGNMKLDIIGGNANGGNMKR